ncbi:MAG TPA: TonB-dependent receptor [Vicinamibacteria bacterium]
MTSGSLRAARLPLGVVWVLGLIAGAASAQPIATLEAATGQVSVLRLGQTQTVSPAMPLQLNDVLVTRQGRASVRFLSDGSVLRVGPESRVEIDENATGRDIKLFFGRIWAHVIRWKERPTRFSTGSTIAAIRGTELSVSVATDGNETEVAVLEGSVETKTDTGNPVTLQGGQAATGAKGRAAAIDARVKPQDAVQWALYYPPVLYAKAGAPESASQRAAAKLAAGSVEEAAKDLDAALKANPNDASALALSAIVSVATNRADAALDTAKKAVAADPKSSAALIALSYAQQAHFDLEGARASLEQAVTLDPEDALAWARLAEIRSSLGESGPSLEAARKAAELEPGLARAQTVLGFSQLSEVRTAEAAAAFRKAIELDGSDPLPRLGLGLARIRDGALAEGTKELETAVSLDPGQATVRSYLGKAYFEQKRVDLVDREYDLAKQADANDPTPWLYDAISKQTTNRPVEALESFQKAVELNDNRAVYRSRLLLDSDLAARSASLGRIFSDLGFQDRGLVEGWSSLGADPSNFSAHRLLADNYAALPRHEIARVSELLQSQMLQPLNTTPIQPSLGESNLFLISSQGPGTLAFNEFNPLFNRNQVNGQGSFLLGEDDTVAGEGILSGIYKKLSFSAGYSGYQTEGFRENNTQDDKIANVFLQAELSPRTSLQAEFRYRDLETGDLGLHFYEDDFSRLQSEKTNGTSVRVGLRQELAAGATLLASYMHADKDIDFALPDPDLGQSFALGRDEKADSIEAQLLFRGPKLKVVAGAGYFDIDAQESTVFAIDDPLFGFSDTTTGDAKTKHSNLYAYAYFTPIDDLTLTVGASGDLFDETGEFVSEFQIPGLPPDAPVPVDPAPVLGEKNQFNPKLGVSWSLASGTTLRGAWFKTLKRTLVTDQTLEPTQVAGFNQFFDDPSATESEVWGLALDQKLGRKAFGGIAYSERELTIPQLLLEDGLTWTVNELPGEERLVRAYLFGAVHPWLTLGAEYGYEEFEYDPELFLSFSTVKTHRVPFSARFFHPSGFSALLGVTYLKQEGEFRPAAGAEFLPGDRSFWVVDAALRYRLPKRYGFVTAGVNNLTDETQTYEATDPGNLTIRPGRVVYARVVLALP